jgi:flagellar biosynthesis/type III secretory pathway M-ring protein FliF/YscJ
MNGTTKIILICAGIGVVVLVVMFFLIRKKGKYR